MYPEGPRGLTVTVYSGTDSESKELPNQCFLYGEPLTDLTGLSFSLC